MFYNLKNIINHFIISIILVMSLSIIIEHNKWFDVSFFEIFIVSIIIFPFVISSSIFIKNIIKYGNIIFAIDDSIKAFNSLFKKFNYKMVLIEKYNEYFVYSHYDEKFKVSIKYLFTSFTPEKITYEEVASQKILITTILHALEYDDNFIAKQKIYNAFCANIRYMKDNKKYLDEKTNNILNIIYNNYVNKNTNISWEYIYHFSNIFINFLEIYYSSLKKHYNANPNDNNNGKTYNNSDKENVNIYEEHYRVLNLSISASFNDVKKSYKKLMKTNHPDKFMNADNSVKMKANEISKKITFSYSVLKKALQEQ